MALETKRLLLREMNPGDFDALLMVFGDPETMWHYPFTFDGQHVRDWIERKMNRYRKDGFGLWAVCLKDTGEVIGDCGLTLQNIDGETLPEIGYHIRRDCQRKGYASEAARAVRNWAFQNTGYPALYSYCKYTNTASIRTAESIGMRFDREYPDAVNGTTHVSVIRREELAENMIRWAEARLGSGGYAGWCLSFIEDALEKGNGLEIFGGDSARASCELYSDALRSGAPERGAFVFYDCLCKADEGFVNWGHCGIGLGGGRVIHAWDVARIDDYRQIETLATPAGNHPKYLGWVPLERVLEQKPDAVE